MTNLLYRELTDSILGVFYKVYTKLGFGFLEKVYENAMFLEFKKQDLLCSKQQPISVYYEGQEVGNYFADLIVENKVIVELKASAMIIPEHEAQLLNYLKATEIEVGLILNFGPKPTFSRKVFENRLK